MRATRLRDCSPGGEPRQPKPLDTRAPVKQHPSDSAFDMDEEIEDAAASALIRRHRSLVLTESRHSRF